MDRSGTVTATGDITITTELELNSGTTFNVNSNTLTSALVDINGTGILSMTNGSLIFSTATGLTSNVGSTFNVGPGANVTGITAKSTFESQNNYSVVGNIENLDVTNEELNVMGQVINCTGDIIQQHQTQDAAQQLDFDSAEDRDVMLGRDLDKNTELVG